MIQQAYSANGRVVSYLFVQKALFSPVKIDDESCYNAIPVVQLSKETFHGLEKAA